MKKGSNYEQQTTQWFWSVKFNRFDMQNDMQFLIYSIETNLPTMVKKQLFLITKQKITSKVEKK